MRIEVYGPGCTKCNQSADAARAFVEKHSLDAEVVKVTELDAIVARGVLRTPATFIDGNKIVGGRVLREKDLEDWLTKRPQGGVTHHATRTHECRSDGRGLRETPGLVH